MHFAHALATAASRCLDKHRVANSLSELARIIDTLDYTVGTRNRRHAAHRHGLTRSRLIAHSVDALGGGADEYQIVVSACACEIGILGQEAIARMHSLATRGSCRGDDVRHIQVRLASRSRANAYGFVGIANGQRVFVGRGIYRNRFHAQLASGAHNA